MPSSLSLLSSSFTFLKESGNSFKICLRAERTKRIDYIEEKERKLINK